MGRGGRHDLGDFGSVQDQNPQFEHRVIIGKGALARTAHQSLELSASMALIVARRG